MKQTNTLDCEGGEKQWDPTLDCEIRNLERLAGVEKVAGVYQHCLIPTLFSRLADSPTPPFHTIHNYFS